MVMKGRRRNMAPSGRCISEVGRNDAQGEIPSGMNLEGFLGEFHEAHMYSHIHHGHDHGLRCCPDRRSGWTAPKCRRHNATDGAKSHKLFLYFPTVDDDTFPAFEPLDVSPARKFDVADLDPSIGTPRPWKTGSRHRGGRLLRVQVQVRQTTRSIHTDIVRLPPRRRTMAIGSDQDAISSGRWGQAQVDLDDDGRGRLRAGLGRHIFNCEGGDGTVVPFNDCSMTGALTGSQLDARALGGGDRRHGGT